MENFIGLIVIFVIWGVISVMRKSAKAQQTAFQQKMNQNSQSAPIEPKPVSTTDEINKLIEMLTGAQPSRPTPRVATIPVQIDNSDSIESLVEAGGFEVTRESYSTIDNYTPITASIEVEESESNLHSMLTNYRSGDKTFQPVEKSIHPILSEFDLRKAVIYSEILNPRYF